LRLTNPQHTTLRRQYEADTGVRADAERMPLCWMKEMTDPLDNLVTPDRIAERISASSGMHLTGRTVCRAVRGKFG